MNPATKTIIIRAMREDFNKNAGWLDANEWIKAAIDLGLWELAKEFKNESKFIKNAI